MKKNLANRITIRSSKPDSKLSVTLFTMDAPDYSAADASTDSGRLVTKSVTVKIEKETYDRYHALIHGGVIVKIHSDGTPVWIGSPMHPAQAAVKQTSIYVSTVTFTQNSFV